MVRQWPCILCKIHTNQLKWHGLQHKNAWGVDVGSVLCVQENLTAQNAELAGKLNNVVTDWDFPKLPGLLRIVIKTLLLAGKKWPVCSRSGIVEEKENVSERRDVTRA